MASAAWAEGAGGEDLECRVEWQLPSRVQALDAHPTRPLVALGLADGVLQVWDYATGVRVFEWSGQAEAEGEAHEHAAQELLQKGAEWRGPREEGAAAAAAALEKIKFGAARLVRFVDDDVRHWTARRAAASGAPIAAPAAAAAPALSTSGLLAPPAPAGSAPVEKRLSEVLPTTPRGGRGGAGGAERQVLYAGDAWAALVSYNGGRTRRFETEKSVTAVEWVARLGCVALGHADGTVRLADPDAPGAAVDSTRTVKAHTRPVARLFAYEARGEAMLLSAGQDGVVCVWTLSAPLAEEKKDKERGTANPMRYKIHSSEGLTASGLVLSDEMLYTAGADKHVCVWDVRNAKEVLKTRALRSAALVACEPLSHPRFAPGSCLVAAGGEHKARIMVAEVRAEEGGAKDKKKADDEALRIRDIANTGELWVRPGKKKGPRVQALWLHPLLPHLFFVATKCGLILASLEPHRAPAFAQPEPVPRPLALLTLPDERLLAFAGGARASSVGLTVEREGRKVRVLGSPSGRMLATHAWDTGRYSVHLATAPYTLQEEGYARSLAWGPGDGLLLLELRAGVATEAADAKKKKKDKAPTERPPPRQTALWKESLGSLGTDLSATLRGADRLHPGQLLGVESEPDGAPATLQFYAWGTWLPVGAPLPAPLVLRWHPKEPLLLLAYRTYALVARLGPTSLAPLCFLPRSVSSALWHHQALLYATPATVELFFPARLPAPPVVLASFRPAEPPAPPAPHPHSPSGPAHGHVRQASSAPVPTAPRRAGLLGAVAARPAGSVALVAVHDEALWLLESSEDRLSSVPLSAPPLRALMHVAARQWPQALATAAQVQACYHRTLAALFASLDEPREALRLPALALAERLDLCRAARLHDDAPDVVAACSAARDAAAADDDDAAAATRPAAPGESGAALAAAALGLARAADLAGAYRKSLALYREALRINADAHRPMVAFYVRNGKMKKLASLQKKQQAGGKLDEAAFSGLFLEPDAFAAALAAAHPPLARLADPAAAAPLHVRWGGLPDATLLPPDPELL